MKALDWVAVVVLFFELPIPLFWLILHGGVQFWRRHVRLGYLVAVSLAWGGVILLLLVFHEQLFASVRAPRWAILVGLALIASDFYVLYRAERDLGRKRLVGQAELQGSGELATKGIYATVRHPRYTSMMLSVAGACLIGGTLALWAVAAIWWLLALLAVNLEERELRVRFGAAYIAYAKRVPRFLPFRLWPRRE